MKVFSYYRCSIFSTGGGDSACFRKDCSYTLSSLLFLLCALAKLFCRVYICRFKFPSFDTSPSLCKKKSSDNELLCSSQVYTKTGHNALKSSIFVAANITFLIAEPLRHSNDFKLYNCCSVLGSSVEVCCTSNLSLLTKIYPDCPPRNFVGAMRGRILGRLFLAQSAGSPTKASQLDSTSSNLIKLVYISNQSCYR